MSDIGLDLDGLAFLIILIMFGPAILFAIIGGILRYNQKKKAAKVFFILSATYLVISLGVCGSMIFA
jgi:Na+/H+-dicarboxylate symporter